MNSSRDMIIGSTIVIFITFATLMLYLMFFSYNDIKTTITTLYHQKYLAEIITKCTFLNLLPLFLMIINRKDGIAKWILTITINIFTLFL